VTSVRPTESGYLVRTDQGDWRCRTLVLATGACNIAGVPAFAARVPRTVAQLTAQQYRNPGQLADGGVMVVGASSSGTQIAHEIHRSGRPVVLAVGEHIRAPRLYRGKDLEWWMDAAGVLDERYDQVDDIKRARRVPSLQLAGTPDRSTLDLNALTCDRGEARRPPRRHHGERQDAVCRIAAQHVRPLRSQNGQTFGSDRRMGARQRSLRPRRTAAAPAADPRRGCAAARMDLAAGAIKTIIWATGYRPDYSWLEVPVLDRKGMIRHDGGVVAAPGMYLMGAVFLRRRKSTLIDGAGDDARELSAHLASYLDGGLARLTA
jgi:hypothetical protein